MKLTREQFTQLHKALLDAYTSDELRRMLRFGLGLSLSEITPSGSDKDVVFDLIEWAERVDQVPALIDAAAANNPDNLALRQLRQDAAGWFGPAGAQAATSPARPAAPGPAPVPPASVGRDNLVINIGSGSSNIAAGKNVRQSIENSEMDD